jgi:hypothetical protein
MTASATGMVAGMGLGLATYLGGFPAFLTVAALGALGFLVGRALDGGLDRRQFLRGPGGGRGPSGGASGGGRSRVR